MAHAKGLIAQPTDPVILSTRELEWEDLPRLFEHRRTGEKRRLQNIRSIHHKIARMMAMGCSNVEICATLGFHPARISVLRSDPAFCELLAHYEEQEADVWKGVRERAAELGMTAAEVLHDRLLENPETIKSNTLLEIMKGGFDYGGHRPAQRSESLHVHTTAEEIERIKAGRKEAVSVRQSPVGGADDMEATEGEFVEATDEGSAVRETSADGDREDAGEAGEESVALVRG